MPEFIYAGQTPASYTETRDSGGFIVGTVEHGNTRDFGADGDEKPEDAPEFWPAPDGRWFPAGTQIAKAWDGVGADMYRQDDAAGREDAAEDEDPPPASGEQGGAPPPDDTGSTPQAQETVAVARLDGTSGEEQ